MYSFVNGSSAFGWPGRLELMQMSGTCLATILLDFRGHVGHFVGVIWWLVCPSLPLCFRLANPAFGRPRRCQLKHMSGTCLATKGKGDGN